MCRKAAEPCPSWLRKPLPVTIMTGFPHQATWVALRDSGTRQLVRCVLCYWLELVLLEMPQQRRVPAARLKYRRKEWRPQCCCDLGSWTDAVLQFSDKDAKVWQAQGARYTASQCLSCVLSLSSWSWICTWGAAPGWPFSAPAVAQTDVIPTGCSWSALPGTSWGGSSHPLSAEPVSLIFFPLPLIFRHLVAMVMHRQCIWLDARCFWSLGKTMLLSTAWVQLGAVGRRGGKVSYVRRDICRRWVCGSHSWHENNCKISAIPAEPSIWSAWLQKTLTG